VEPDKIRVVAVDHNPLLREGLAALVRAQPDMELISAAGSASEAVDLFDRHRPDVILIDLNLPRGEAIRAIRHIRKIDPRACILGLLTYEWDEACAEALGAGAWRCVAKDSLDAGLVTLIRQRCG
jgi:two-component system NarL family response regulator